MNAQQIAELRSNMILLVTNSTTGLAALQAFLKNLDSNLCAHRASIGAQISDLRSDVANLRSTILDRVPGAADEPA